MSVEDKICFLIVFLETFTLVCLLWKYRSKKQKKETSVQQDVLIYKTPIVRGACGVTGCKNQRPHSHVADLARRLNEMNKESKK